MDTVRAFYPRRRSPMGQVSVPVILVNEHDPTRELRFDAVVDTGAFGLILPTAWKERLGPLPHTATVKVETADQRVLTAEVCGPVRIQIDGFRAIDGQVVFMDMTPSRGSYEPLVGYPVLELAGAVVDMVTHRLVARRTFDLKQARTAAGDGLVATAVRSTRGYWLGSWSGEAAGASNSSDGGTRSSSSP